MRERIGILALAATALGLLATAHPTAQPPQPRPGVERVNGSDAVSGEVLLKVRSDASPGAAARIAALAGADSMPVLGRSGVRRVRSRTQSVPALLERLRRDPDVLYAEPNFIVRPFAEPVDPLFPQLWGLRNEGQSVNGGAAGRAGADIHASAAWDLSIGDTARVVAVVDSGIDYTHPDLAPNMWSAPAPFTVTLAGVAITCPAGSHGFDARTLTCDPMAGHDHGTHVAGTIGAAGHNGLGVVGVNWTTRLMGIRFIGADGTGTVADAIAGLEFAVQAKRALGAGADVRVLSNSWGGRTYSQALRDQIAVTAGEDMLFVAAAGNNGLSNDWFPTYPASYDVPNVVAVAASTNTDDRAWFSNYGTRTVHLAAPGVDILSTVNGGRYGFSSGTSMAAPHVAGAAALVLSRCPLETAALKEALVSTAERVTALAAFTATGGRLDVNSAIRSCSEPPAAPRDLAAAAADGRVTLTWSAVPGATSYIVHRGLTAGGPYAVLSSGVTSRTYVDTVVVNDTTYYYVVSAANSVGESGYSNEVSARPKAPSDLVIAALTVPSIGGSGLPLQVSTTTKNQGVGVSVATVTRFYLSRNGLVDAGDTVLDDVAVAPLSPGTQATAAVSLTLPGGLASGYWYVIAVADATQVEAESQEFNNAAARLVTIGPDLTASAVTAPAAAGAGTTIGVGATVKNVGGGAAGASVTRFYLSANVVFDASDVLLTGGFAVPLLGPGESFTGGASVVVPAATPAGGYYLFAVADADGSVPETQEGNNAAPRWLAVGGDLVVSALTVPAKAGSGAAITVTDTTRNAGTGAVAASVTRFHLSTNGLLDPSDTLLAGGRAVPPLEPGAVSTGSIVVTLPTGLVAGTYYIIASADADQGVPETQEANNTLTRAVAIGPDLWISMMTVPYYVSAGATITVADTVTNQGGEAAGTSVTRFYLSTNAVLDAGDVLLPGSRAVGALAIGASSAGSTGVLIPAGTTPGTYFVLAKTDADGVVAESQETNNVAARVVQVSP